jgi:hypothetical protein
MIFFFREVGIQNLSADLEEKRLQSFGQNNKTDEEIRIYV